MKSVVFLCDGMADYPVEALGGKTPLDVSSHPNMDKIAQGGLFGLAQTVPHGMKPGSDNANLSVFGYDPLVYYTGRSPLEAVNMGITLNAGNLNLVFQSEIAIVLDGDVLQVVCTTRLPENFIVLMSCGFLLPRKSFTLKAVAACIQKLNIQSTSLNFVYA